jgi:hypothetical protein
MVVGRTTYHWCVKHKYWTFRSSKDCKGIKVTSEGNKAHRKASSTDKGDSDSFLNKLLLAMSALVSLLDHDEELE